MTRTPQDVTAAELAVLQVLWLRGNSTIRDIAAVLQPKDQDTYYASVKKLLERLEAKEFVRRAPQGNAYIYQPLVSRDNLVGRRLREVAQTLCEGSLTPLLTQLAQHEQLSPQLQAALHELIEQLSRPVKAKTPTSRRKR